MMMISICSDSIGLHMKVNPCRNPSHHIQREMTYEGHENGYRELGRISGTQWFPSFTVFLRVNINTWLLSDG